VLKKKSDIDDVSATTNILECCSSGVFDKIWKWEGEEGADAGFCSKGWASSVGNEETRVWQRSVEWFWRKGGSRGNYCGGCGKVILKNVQK
jgi:hypothetical protein